MYYTARGRYWQQRKERKEVEITTESIDCAIRHINAFIEQTHYEEIANAGAPCAECRQAETCGYAWRTKLKPLLENSNETIQICFPRREHTGDIHQDLDTTN